MDAICVIGGGVGGVTTAIEAANAGYHVYIIEQKEELLRGSSDVTAGRIGIGFHYFHLPTALKVLHTNINFMRQFGHFRQENDKTADHPLRRGRYFIMKNSIIPAEKILATFDGIKTEYNRLIEKDPENMVFGVPDNIYRIIDPALYADEVNCDAVEIGIETAEEFLDWTKFRRFLLVQLDNLEKEKKVTVYKSHEVVGINHLENKTYIVTMKMNDGTTQYVGARFIINATWESVSTINKMLELNARPRAARLKCIVTVNLPNELKTSPSMFFCVGPFCMFSNKGNGIGMVTFAPVTNIAVAYKTDETSDLHSRLPLSSSDLLEYGRKIVSGAAYFIPKLADSHILSVGTGFVQSYTDELEQKEIKESNNLTFIQKEESSHIHFRNYTGVEKLSDTFIVNSCMKLLNCIENAKLVVNLICRQSEHLKM